MVVPLNKSKDIGEEEEVFGEKINHFGYLERKVLLRQSSKDIYIISEK